MSFGESQDNEDKQAILRTMDEPTEEQQQMTLEKPVLDQADRCHGGASPGTRDKTRGARPEQAQKQEHGQELERNLEILQQLKHEQTGLCMDGADFPGG